MEFAIRCPNQVVFGWGMIDQLPKFTSGLGRRPLMVTGRSALRASGRLDDILGALSASGAVVALFDQVEAEPSLDTVLRGIETARVHEADVVVAIGGGSALDVGKAIAAVAYADGELAEFHAGREVTGRSLPIVAAPTTSGTGAEVTPNSVLTDRMAGVKASIRGAGLIPRVAIVDPELTVSLPPKETAYTGLDAFTQALEAFISTGASPYSDALALEAIRATGSWLREAVAAGRNREARTQMALGSLLAGLALASARLGLVHGLAHPVGARYALPHGLVCGRFLPAVLAFNQAAAAPRYHRAAQALGLESGTALVPWVTTLCEDLGASMPLSTVGASEADIDALVDPVLSAGSTAYNPRKPTAGDVRELLRQAIDGERPRGQA
ncbi:MAG TPA: iron-containing alcohol dehydrogenase [Armatimonadota bacterium]|nr:iron-containing alcohol dehydrogenase [Armatimonadota bacterium]